MNYLKAYNALTSNKAHRHKLNDKTYYEIHHIIPDCLGGSNDISNKVLLTAREHYIAHLLLTRIYPHSVGLHSATFLLKGRLKCRYSSRLYEANKIKFVKLQSARMLGENNHFYGKSHSDNSKLKMKASRSRINLLGENNSNFGNRWTWDDKGYDKSKLANRKRGDLSKPETKFKLSNAKKGDKNPMSTLWTFRNKLSNEIVSFTGGMKSWCTKQGTSIKKIRSGTHPIWEII